MKRQILTIALFLLSAVMIGDAYVEAQRQSNSAKPANSEYSFSGPYSHKNLTIFLVHGKDQTTGKTPLTLQEAIKQKKVVVRETGDVNNLTIQNRSLDEVFVQAGDIVKGGQQDRVLALDLILPPKSGRISIDAFCVEHSRWNQRGQEAVTAFSSSDKMVSTRGLKLAVRNSQSQGEVWDNVSVAQAKLARNYAAASGVPGGVPGGRATDTGGGLASGSDTNFGGGQFAPPPAPTAQIAIADRGGNAMRISEGVLSGSRNGSTLAEQVGLTAVTSKASPTSLQLTLENKNVKESSNAYTKELASIIEGKRDVIGYVFAINRKLNSADVYSSNALFKKLWPKLIEASAVEAFAEIDQTEKFDPVTVDLAKAFLRDAESGKVEEKNLRPRTKLVKRETEKNLFFEARHSTRGEAWVHRNYLSK